MRLKLLCDYAPRSRQKRNLVVADSMSLVGPRRPDMMALPTSWAQQAASTRALVLPVQLPELPNSACSLELSSADHEAIRYYRTTFARMNHTKHPDYSLFSIMFKVGEREPMVMRMLLALGGREMEFRCKSTSTELSSARWTPLQHYSAALRLMADAIGNADDGRYLDLDSVCTALYLMVVYEQKYGDARCSGLTNHLSGAALILEHHFRDLPLWINGVTSGLVYEKPAAMNSLCQPGKGQQPMLSQFSVRLLLWMLVQDSAASTYGIGGQLNGVLHQIMGGTSNEIMPPVKNLDRLIRFTNPLYRIVWGDSYPQTELVDDVENRDVFSLLGACSQLRFTIDRLRRADRTAAQRAAPAVESLIREMGDTYSDLLEVAAELSMSTDNSHRLVANIRAIVPAYHAAVVDFLSLGLVSGGVQMTANLHMRSIMNLAFQAFKHEGNEAMVRIAWPLFVVALETADMLHRDWILSRFQGMCHFGKNLARAHDFLVNTLGMQARLGHRVSVRDRFQSGEVELFVI